MMANVPSVLVPVVAKQITLPAGNCFDLAGRYLGDATQIDRIMRLNPQLNNDPFFIGVTTINLPPVNANSGNGGIINL
jgi:hypothetical protein